MNTKFAEDHSNSDQFIISENPKLCFFVSKLLEPLEASHTSGMFFPCSKHELQIDANFPENKNKSDRFLI